MIKHYPYEALGNVNHGWLNAHHHFSFGHYWNPERVQFGQLRVINDDIIAPQAGFGTHPHDNMEIITYVRQGAISHKDSMGNAGRTEAGDVQVMSAGTGIAHSEYNKESEETRLYQIWITPDQRGVKPRWEARQFPKDTLATGALPVLVSGDKADAEKGALYIHQDAAIYGGRVKAGATLMQPLKHNAYVLASEGSFTLNGITMKKGDGAEVTGESALTLRANEDAEILVIDVA
ncbi:MAG: pirin family protein [Alphaproteobacteria bacterium]|nr:pirin family protein [Alphaproteobacteria bacterium]MBV8547907.1 pirin family protein [Alphaproteobacteria bacterium]